MKIARARTLAAASLSLMLTAGGVGWSAGPSTAKPSSAVGPVVAAMESAAGPGLRFRQSNVPDLVRSMTAPKSRGVPVIAAGTAEARALAFLGRYGTAFGLDPTSVRVTRVSTKDATGLEHVRLQQIVDGIPVAGGEAILHIRDDRVESVLARTVPDLDRVPTSPVISAAAAAHTARQLLQKHVGVIGAKLSAPRLEIFNPSLLDGGPFRPSRLAWFIEARTVDRLEYVWLDAADGAILLNFNQMPHGRTRQVYDAGSGSSLPGSLVRSEGEGATGDTDVDLAYLYSGDTYDYFWTEHGRDSFDGAGAALVSTVHYCPSAENCPYANAFWNGSQMVYGEGFASADDVVAHELTHAVTERTAGLYYYMQSGALNESFSDIFGEAVDLGNGHGSDLPADRWLMGEDLPGGALRDMWEPNTHFQPGRMSDPWFFCDANQDNGGVHFNSGVPNLAFALMVDGGSYNGFTVSAIGLSEAAAIHYRVLTQYLVSGSDFADHAEAVDQACTDLVGTAGITAADCLEAGKALDAVEISDPWSCLPAQSGEPALCGGGKTAVDLAAWDFETNPWTDWTLFSDDPSVLWAWYSGGYSASGGGFVHGENPATLHEYGIILSSDLAIPAGGAKLRFTHSYGFEHSAIGFYDGGLVLYSTDSGANWHVADCSTCEGLPYQGTISTAYDNPRAGQTGFVGNSFGYAITQLDLGGFAGQNLRLGFDISSDSSIGDFGWAIDNVRIFQCVTTGGPHIFSDGFESGNTTVWTSTIGGGP